VKRHFILIVLIIITVESLAQKALSDKGYFIKTVPYNGDTLEILVKTENPHKLEKKLIFLFCHGSLPRPLGVREKDGTYSIAAFPFNISQELLHKYHFVSMSKAQIPAIPDEDLVDENFWYKPKNPDDLLEFWKRDYLDYYVGANTAVVNYLITQTWVDPSQFVISGHSQGSHVATKVASESSAVTHLIFSAGNPMGRMMNMISAVRDEEDSESRAEGYFKWWNKVVENPTDSISASGGDSFKSEFTFNEPVFEALLDLSIPVLVSYGTRDHGVLFNDFLRIEAIRRRNKYIKFKDYIGLEHNYFPVDREGNINYEQFGWTNVFNDWMAWIGESSKMK
jgi:predicted esterase